MNKKRKSKTNRKHKPKAGRKHASKAVRKRSSRPLVFISHRHEDKILADVITDFLKTKSGGRVEVFQSSNFAAKGPEIGRNLNEQLRQYLWTASAVILIYTTSDQDWSYCMWECGVAMDPGSPDTKVILFQCAGEAPALFADQVRVDITNSGDIQRFTNEFLTSKRFFPGHGVAMSRFRENDQQVMDAAKRLFDELDKVKPRPRELVEEWPAFPFLRLELRLDHVDTICKANNRTRNQVATKIIKRECLVSEGDKEVGQLFGVPIISKGMVFQKLLDKWARKNVRSNSKWIDALYGQIMDGAQWDFPRLAWEFMPGPDGNTVYAPMLTRVRRIPGECMQFDIYFYKFYSTGKKGKQLYLGGRRSV